MEELLDKAWYLVAILFWLIPTIMRWVAKRRREQPQPPPADPPRAVPATKPAPATRQTAAAPRVSASLPGPAADVGQRESMLARARAALETARDLERRATLHRGAAARLLPVIRDDCAEPLDVIASRLADRGQPLGPGEYQRLEPELARLTRLAGLLGLVLDQRTKVARASLLHLLDGAAQDCLLPYLVHARRLDVPFRAARAVVLIDPAGEVAAPSLAADDLAAAVIEEDALDRPAGWSELASQVALAWVRGVPGLTPRLASELGLPEARSAAAQFQATGRLTIAGLVSMWLPHLAADALASLQLGPAFAAGLAQSLAWTGGPERALECRVGRGFGLGPPPLHLRMYTTCVTLDRLGLEQEASARWERWKKQLGEPAAVVLASDRFPPVSVPLDRAYGYVAGAIEGVMTRPLTPLGGYPLARIPDVALDPETTRAVEAAARSLAAGEPVVEPPRTVLAAAALAADVAPYSESRIRRVALASLGDVGADVAHDPRSSRRAVAGRTNPREMLRDPAFFVRAVAIAAELSRVRGGRVGR